MLAIDKAKVQKLLYVVENPKADLRRVDRYRAVDENGVPYKVVSLHQSEALKRILNYGKDRRHFSFAHMQNIREVIARMSTVNCGRLLMLIGHIDFETGVLVNERGKPMDKNDMREVVKLSERAFRDFFRTMTENDIIQELENGQYRINPQYHFVGKLDDDKAVKAFTAAVRKLADVLKPAELGFVYKLLPHVHYSTNMICLDPFEPDPRRIQFLNAKRIAEVVGMDEKETVKILKRLRKAGVLAETRREDDKRDVLFIVNPFIFYRKKGRPDETLRAMFSAHPY